MNRILAGKLILTFVLVGGAIMSFALDWSSNHLLNPLWHPHARYHAAILLFLFAGVAATATWSLWRHSQEPSAAFTIAALLSLSYWTPFFYVPLLLPSASYWAGIPGREPRIGGAILYLNLLVVGVFATLTVLGWWLGQYRHRSAVIGTRPSLAEPHSGHALTSASAPSVHHPERPSERVSLHPQKP